MRPIAPVAAALALLTLVACAAPARRSGAAAPREGGAPWPAGRPPLDLTGRVALDNGFEAYVVPRPGTPLVAFLVAVKAGSRHETPATRGAAHLLEHLVFEGTARRGRDEIFRWVYGIGGYLNGFTRDDYTGYVLMGPPSEARAMAALLADLLSGARLSAEALARVKLVVLEELRQAESDPAYRDEVRFRAARFAGTPYAEPALGTEATIGAITLEDLARFYRARYAPDNMVALAVGGAGEAEMAAALRDAFGPLGAAAPADVQAPPARLPRAAPGGIVVRASRPGTVRVGFPGPAPGDPDFGDFLALGDLLASPASPLPAALRAVRAPAGLTAAASVETDGGVASLEVRATLGSGGDPDAALAVLVAALERLAAPPAGGATARAGTITPEVAAQGARHARLEAARLAERIHYFAMARAPFLVAGRPDLALGEPPAPAPAALRAALARALGAGFVALLPAAGDGPAAGARTPAPPPPRLESRLANGLTVVAETRPGSPLVAAHLLARGRLLAEPADLPGAAEILHRLLPRGAQGRGGTLEARLAAVGASLVAADDPREPFGNAYFQRDFSGIRLEALAGGAEAALRLLASAVASPTFDPRTVAAARSETAEVADFRALTARTLAEDRLWARLFEGPPGSPPAGSAATFARATPARLAAFHRRYFAPDNLVLTLVGGDTPERLAALAGRTFGRLARGPAPDLAEPRPAPSPGGEPLRVTLESPQGQARVGVVVEARSPRERAALEIATGLLGASLFSNLRDAQGLAYSVGAEASFVGPYGVVTAGLGSGRAALERALGEIRRLVAARASAPVTREEIARRANAIAGRLASRQLSSATRAYYLGAALYAGAPHRFGEDYAALLASVTPAEVEAMQRRAFSRPLTAVIVE